MGAAEVNCINLDYLKLMSGGDREMERTMLAMLLDEIPSEFAKMKILHQSKSWKELGDVSHKMKSTLAFVGHEAATQANVRLEKLAKNEEDLQDIDELMIIFEESIPAILAALKKELNG